MANKLRSRQINHHRAALVLLFAAVWLAGCQQSLPPTATIAPTISLQTRTPPPAVTQPATPTATAVEPSPTPSAVLGVELTELRGLTVEVWHPWQGELDARLQQAAVRFSQSNPWGLAVQPRSWYSAGALQEAIIQARAGEDLSLPAAVIAPSEQLASWAQSAEPALADLREYVTDSRAGLSEEAASAFYPLYWEQDTLDDTRFGLPVLRGARVLLYNQSWAEELGFSERPRTPEQFKAQACAAAEHNNTARLRDLAGTGGWLIDADALTTLSWLAAFGADPLPADPGQPYAFDSPEAGDAVTFLRSLVQDGCAWEARSASAYENFARRKALFYSGTLADIGAQAGWLAQMENTDRWTVIPFPALGGEPLVYSGGYSIGVWQADAKSQLAGWLFARWLSEPENALGLVEAGPSLPVSAAQAEKLRGTQQGFPWEDILSLTEFARPAPSAASWRVARRPLEDAAWQIYHLPPEILGEVLPYLDETIQDMLAE